MKFSEFYSNAQKELLRTFTSMFSKGKPEYSGHLQYILGEKEKEKLMIEPVFQSVFPWESDKHRMGDLCGLLGESFIDALDKAVFSEPMTDNDKEVKVENVAFPKNINPYLHQVKSWEAVLKKRKSILVTTGTGSGKTECFMVPVLKQLYDDKIKAGINNPGVQAIFLYPLNALIASQRKRIHGWCKALNPSVTYGIYTGETKESATKRETESYFPQIIDRQTLRSRPPQILFTNATILEYMMIRASDNELIAKSSDLKWIILDEAHTYNGSSATEMALLIKRILQVFGKKPEEVNFAITSATIGEGKEAEMKEFISRLTGKNASDFEFITGKRVIPQPDADSVKSRIDEINAKTGYRITPAAIKKVREKLNNNPSLSATEITDELKCKNISTVERLELIDMLSEAGTVKVAGNDSSALLPVRGHFMARSLNGLYACSNPECKSYKENHIDIGSLTSFRASNCPDCGGRMLEVVACGDCGSYLLQGEKELIKDMNSTEPEKYYMKDNTLENDLLVDWDPDIDNEEQDSEIIKRKKGPGKTEILLGKGVTEPPLNNTTIYPLYLDPVKGETGKGEKFILCNNPSKRADELLCPVCGASHLKARRIVFPASFESRILSHLLLEQSPENKDVKNQSQLVYKGKKFITFTDNRQSTAKIARSLDVEVEREWARSTIFELLMDNLSVPEMFTEEDEEKLKKIEELVKTDPSYESLMRPQFIKLLEKKEAKAKPEPQSWEKYSSIYINNQDLKKLYDGAGVKGKKESYLKSLFIDQMANRPLRSNSLETLGLVALDYPAINNLSSSKVPDEFKGFYKYDSKEAALDDWKNLLRIFMDFFVRRNMHVMFPEDVRNLVTKNYYSDPVYAPDLDLIKRNNNENVKRWPQLRNIKSGSSYIDRTCLLLLLAAGITNIESVDEKTQETVNIILRKAWRFISENILTDVKENIDYNTATYKGYKLDILDKDKVRFALVEKAVVCPMTNQFLNCTFHNISPLVKGKLDPNTLNRYSVKTPFTDIPLQKSKREFTKGGVFDNEKWRVYFDNWFEAEYEPVMQKLSGGFNMQRNIFMQRDIFLAAEHSGQIDGSVLRESERKFEDGKLNILSCSTTMEMGVDIGGISVVVMNNIPPKPANYLQRAGRAGRRKETQSLALTFCNDTPIGNTVLKNPKWALDHDIASPAMNFRSRTILKRHINALLLGEYIRACSGSSVSDEIGTFINGYKYNNPKSGINYTYEGFRNFLIKCVEDDNIVNKVRRILKDTIMEGDEMESIVNETISLIELICEEKAAIIKNLQKQIDEAGNQRYRKKLEYILESIWNKNMLISLSENKFIPSASIPTNIAELIIYADIKDNARQNMKNPQRLTAQAIQDYAPGKEVVVSNLVFPVEGILMQGNALQGNSVETKISYCVCGYISRTNAEAPRKCPRCDKKMLSVLDGHHQHYALAIEPVSYIAGESRRSEKKNIRKSFIQPELLGMEPWEDTSDVYYRLRTSVQEESKIIFHNKGEGLGFALCEYCGKMEPEQNINEKDNKNLPKAMINHVSILNGRRCYGNQAGNNIKRNVMLSALYQTDIAELKVKTDLKGDDKEKLLYSLGTILSRTFATSILGVNDDEIDFGVTRNSTIFIYDTTSGGAGYSALLPNHIEKLLDICRENINSCNCKESCTNCLIDRKSQWMQEKLDRHILREWLNKEFEERQDVPSEVAQCFGGEVKKITGSPDSDILSRLSAPDVKNVKFFYSENSDNNIITESLELLFKRMMLKGKSIYPVFPKINSPKKTLSAETRTLILNNKVKYGEVCYIIDNIYGMEPLIQYSEGNDLITYVRKDGYYYRGKNYEGLDVASYDISEMLSQGSDSHLFVTMMKEKEIYSNCYLNYILDEHLDKLKDFSGNIKERKIDISYTEIYICRPVDCILLIQLIKQFIRDYKFEINKLIIKTGDKDNLFGRNSYNGTKETLNDKFLNADDRNEFLKECIEEILGEDCDYEIITNEKLPHYRLLTIDNDEFELTLNPDGGLGFGLKYWGRDDAESLEFKGKGLKLVNTISLNNDHIRLTMGWNKK